MTCKKARWFCIATVVLTGASAARGDSLSDIRRACIERGNFHEGIHWLEECVQEMFTAEPFHVTLTSIAPGAGIAAFGPAYSMVPRIRSFEFLLSGTAAVANDGSYIGRVEMTFALPTRGLTQLDGTKRSASQKFGMHAAGRRPEEDPVDAKMSVTLGFRKIDAREQAFFGLGPASLRSAQASYGLLLTETYAGVNNPFTSWSSIGVDVSVLVPRVTSSIDNTVPGIRTTYSSTTAPGLNSRDDFLHYEPYLILRFPARRSSFTTLRVGYAFYQDLGNRQFSFQRLLGRSSTAIPLWVPSKHTAEHRSWPLNTVCPSLRNATRCSLGDLTLSTNIAVSYKGANSQVPFFLDPTLGGSDFTGNDTLRGFTDYRFRAPSSILFQIEHRHPLWGPIGLLSFYDLGKVADLPSDISLNHLRHDIGVGIYLRAGQREIGRLYIGFGSGEGSRLKPKFPVSF